MSKMIISLGFDFTEAIFPLFESATYAFLMVYLVVFGIRLLYGGIEKIPRATFEFIFKFAFVFLCINNLDIVMVTVFDIMDGLLLAVSDATQLSTGYRCGTGSAYSFFAAPPTLWERIDCMLDIVIGINSPRLLADGMLAFFFYNIFSGAASLIIGLIGLWITYNLVLGIFKAIETYLLSVFTIVLLVVIGVLFIPLIFLSTLDYFKTWFKTIGGVIIQPVVMFAYLNVVMAGLDVVLYSGEYSVFRVYAGTQVDDPQFRINNYIEDNQLLAVAVPGPTLDQNHSIFNSGVFSPIQGLIRNTVQSGDKNALKLDPNDIAQMPLGVPVQGINWEKSAEILDPPLDKAAVTPGGTLGGLLESKVFAAMLVAALVSYILLLLLNNIHYIAGELSGKAKHMGFHEASAVGRISEGGNPYLGGLSAQGMTNKALGGAGKASSAVRDTVTGLAGGARAAAARKAAGTAAAAGSAARAAGKTVSRPGAVAAGAAAASAAAAGGASAAGAAASAATGAAAGASRTAAALSGSASGATKAAASAATSVSAPATVARPGLASSNAAVTNVSYTPTAATTSGSLGGTAPGAPTPGMAARMALQQKIEEDWAKKSDDEKAQVRAQRAEQDRQREEASKKEMDDRRATNDVAVTNAADALGVDKSNVRVNMNGTLTVNLEKSSLNGEMLSNRIAGSYGRDDSLTIDIKDAENPIYVANLKNQAALAKSEIAEMRKNPLGRKRDEDDEEEIAESIGEPVPKATPEPFERADIRKDDPFAPKDLADMTPQERERALAALYEGSEELAFTVNGKEVRTSTGKLTAEDIRSDPELFASIDNITGQSSAERIVGTGSADRIDAIAASATITETIRSPFDEPVTGQSTTDALVGGAGNDTLQQESIRTPFDGPVDIRTPAFEGGPPQELAEMSQADRDRATKALYEGTEQVTFKVNGQTITTTTGKLTAADVEQNKELFASIDDVTGQSSAERIAGGVADETVERVGPRQSLQEQYLAHRAQMTEEEKLAETQFLDERNRQEEEERQQRNEQLRQENDAAISNVAEAMGVAKEDVRMNPNGTVTVQLKSGGGDIYEENILQSGSYASATTNSLTLDAKEASNPLYVANLKAQVELSQEEVADARTPAWMKEAEQNAANAEAEKPAYDGIRDAGIGRKQETDAAQETEAASLEERDERVKKEQEMQQAVEEERADRVQKEKEIAEQQEMEQIRKIDNDNGGSFA